MNLAGFLTGLLDQGINLWLEGNQLRYRAPKGVITEEIRAVLVNRKADVLRFLEQNSQMIRAAASMVVPVERNDRIPLSFAQERLWFIDRMQPGGTGYNIPRVTRMAGPLAVAALERAINEIRRRHENLRTVFEMKEEGPAQVIREYRWEALAVVDLAGLGEREREAEVRGLI
jgi:hypothetical protein